MKTVIIIVLCVVAYLLIGFGALVMRARTYYINLEDTVLAMLLWPMIVVTYVLYNMAESVRSKAQIIGEKLGRRMKK
jgi:hypothetical protein